MNVSRRAWACLFLSLVGLGLCVALGWMHLGLLRGELLGGAACGGSGSVFNCHAVTAGRFGALAGVPLWVWGLSGYLATALLSLIAWNFSDIAVAAVSCVAAIALFSVVVDALLLAIMITQIKYLCLFCLLTYATNLLQVVAARWVLQRPFKTIFGGLGPALKAFVPGAGRPYAGFFWGALLLSGWGGFAVHAASAYVTQGTPGMLRRQLDDFVSKESREHVATEGDPSEGPATAAVTVVEFSDFFCPACQKASRFKPILLSSHRQDVRFVFKHYPLDTSCNDAISRMVHPGACNIAAASECARQQGKFWAFHDLIFTYGHDYPVEHLQVDIQRLGINRGQFDQCMSSGQAMEAVRRDVAEGKRLGITSTPTFFVNGLKVPGIMTPSVFEMLIETLRSEGRAAPASSSP